VAERHGQDAPNPLARRTSAEPSRLAVGGPVLRGRCFAAESRAPLVGVEVRLTTPSSTRNQPGPVTTTGEDGAFQFELERRAPVFAAWFTAMQRIPLVASSIHLQPGAVRDLGDITMELGTRLTARVVDRVGHPVAGVDLSLVGGEPPDLLQPIRRVLCTRLGRSDQQGAAVFDELVPAGTWRVDFGVVCP
jgi:hypothetical protein